MLTQKKILVCSVFQTDANTKDLGTFDISLNATKDNIDGFKFYCDNAKEMNNVLKLMSHYKIPYIHSQEKIEYIYTDNVLDPGDINFISGVLHNIED